MKSHEEFERKMQDFFGLVAEALGERQDVVQVSLDAEDNDYWRIVVRVGDKEKRFPFNYIDGIEEYAEIDESRERLSFDDAIDAAIKWAVEVLFGIPLAAFAGGLPKA